jgi:hypothetical protein
MTEIYLTFGDILTTLYQHRYVKVNENKQTFRRRTKL